MQRSFGDSYSSYGANDSLDTRESKHCHTKKPDNSGTKAAQRKLTIASIVCLIFLIGEFIGKYFCFQMFERNNVSGHLQIMIFCEAWL